MLTFFNDNCLPLSSKCFKNYIQKYHSWLANYSSKNITRNIPCGTSIQTIKTMEERIAWRISMEAMYERGLTMVQVDFIGLLSHH